MIKIPHGADFLTTAGVITLVGIVVVYFSAQHRPKPVEHAVATPVISTPVVVTRTLPVYEMKLIGGPHGEARIHCISELNGKPWEVIVYGATITSDRGLYPISDVYLKFIKSLSDLGLVLRVDFAYYALKVKEGRAFRVDVQEIALSEGKEPQVIRGEIEKVIMQQNMASVYPCILTGETSNPSPNSDNNIHFPDGLSISVDDYVAVHNESANPKPTPPVVKKPMVKKPRKNRCADGTIDCMGVCYTTMQEAVDDRWYAPACKLVKTPIETKHHDPRPSEY